MWTRLAGFLRNRFPRSETRSIDNCEILSADGDTLTVRPLARRLHSDESEALAGQVRERQAGAFDRVHFDFSHVAELTGPWGVHLAMLIKLDREMSARVCVTGLHGQPAAVAWLFRESPEVRSLMA